MSKEQGLMRASHPLTELSSLSGRQHLSRAEASSQTLQTRDEVWLTRKERLDIVFVSLITSQEEDTQVKLTTEQKKLRAQSWEKKLTAAEVPPFRYEEVYNAAALLYAKTDAGKGPFTIFHLLRVWEDIQERERKIRMNPKFTADSFRGEGVKLLRPAPSCSACNGTMIELVREEGKLKIVYEEVEEGKTRPKPCQVCGEEVSNGEQEAIEAEVV